MKTLLIAVWIVASFFATAKHTLSLNEAIAQGLVTVEIASNPGKTNSHFGNCLKVELTSKAQEKLQILIQAGRFIMPDDTSVQRMMVTRDGAIEVAPGQSASHELYAMCTEKYKSGPARANSFSVGMMATGVLQKLAGFLSENDIQDMQGQDAVWVITDNISPHVLCGTETGELLTGFLTEHAHITAPDCTQDVFTPPPPQIQMNGSMSFTWDGDAEVLIGVFNEAGELVKTVVKDEVSGYHQYSYEYQFSLPADNTEGGYVLRLNVGGKTIKEQPIQIPSY